MTRSEEQALCGVCQAPVATHADGECPPADSAPAPSPPDLSAERGADAVPAGASGPVTAPAEAAGLPDRPAGVAPGGADSPAPAPSAPELGNGQAVTGLVLGLLSVFCCWLGLIAAALVLLALAFSVIGILRARLHFSDGLGVAVAGVVFGAAGLGLYLAFGALGLGMGFRF